MKRRSFLQLLGLAPLAAAPVAVAAKETDEAQQIFNYWRTTSTELVALTPLSFQRVFDELDELIDE